MPGEPLNFIAYVVLNVEAVPTVDVPKVVGSTTKLIFLKSFAVKKSSLSEPSRLVCNIT